MSQVFECNNVAYSYTAESCLFLSWSLLDLNGNPVPSAGSITSTSGDVMTFDQDYTYDAGTNSSGTGQYFGAGTVLITINTPGEYVIHATRHRYYAFVADPYNQQVCTIVKKPSVTIGAQGSNCTRNVSITSPQAGVTYNWNNGTSGNNTSFSSNYSIAYVVGTVTTSNCGTVSSPYSDVVSIPAPDNSLAVTGSSSFCKSYQTFHASTCAPVNSSDWSWNVSPSSGVSSLSSSNQSTTGCDRFFQFTQSGYYTIYCSNGSLNGQFQVYVNNCFQGGTYGLQVSNDGKNVKGKSLDNTIIGSENPDIVLINPNSNVTVLSSTFIYPNPSNEEFTISGLEGIDEVRFISVQGQVLQTHKITDGATQQNLKVAQYPNGLYFVQLKNTTGDTRIEKVQVNH